MRFFWPNYYSCLIISFNTNIASKSRKGEKFQKNHLGDIRPVFSPVALEGGYAHSDFIYPQCRTWSFEPDEVLGFSGIFLKILVIFKKREIFFFFSCLTLQSSRTALLVQVQIIYSNYTNILGKFSAKENSILKFS